MGHSTIDSCKRKIPIKGIESELFAIIYQAITVRCKRKIPIKGIESASFSSCFVFSVGRCKRKIPIKGIESEEVPPLSTSRIRHDSERKSQ